MKYMSAGNQMINSVNLIIQSDRSALEFLLRYSIALREEIEDHTGQNIF